MQIRFSLHPLKIFMSILISVVIMCTTGCSDKAPSNTLKVGVMAGPESDLMKVALKKLKKDDGISAKLVEFSDYVSPDIALSDGSIDVNAYQHRPYLESIIKNRGYKLVAVGNTFLYPIGAYSKKINNINELPNGAKVAIPNDPSNEGRSLILLAHKGLITLDNIKNLDSTPVNITKNTKNLKFIELDAAQIPRSLDDVDLAFINSTYAVSAGLLPERDALISEDRHSPYVNLIVTREDNKTDPRIKALVKAYQSKEVATKAADIFKGSAIPGWK